MAQGRFLSRTTATSKQLDAVSWRAELLFLRCIPHLDRDGRMDGDPIMVKATAAPRSAKLPASAIPALLDELQDAGLVTWYVVGGDQVLAFPTFREHQMGMKYEREKPSRFPPPPLRTNSGEGPAEVRTDSADAGDLGRPKGSSSLSGSSRRTGRSLSSSNPEGGSSTSRTPPGLVPPTADELADLERRKADARAKLGKVSA